MDKFVIALGNPFDGIALIGPFDTSEEAKTHGIESFPNAVWGVIPVRAPIKPSAAAAN